MMWLLIRTTLKYVYDRIRKALIEFFLKAHFIWCPNTANVVNVSGSIMLLYEIRLENNFKHFIKNMHFFAINYVHTPKFARLSRIIHSQHFLL